jgi:virulence factor Mce-like protein
VRRLTAIGLIAFAALVAAVAGVGGSGAGAASEYRVDAVFDTAKGIIPGQLVKIAGARVGTVQDVVLTPDAQARIQMSVERRFAPFRTNSRCEIQPEGLIGENFVQCDPGTAQAAQLKGRDGEAPTVPVGRTKVPINLTDLFNIFTSPVRQRFTIVVNELGTGVAGRGKDFNAILRRANPTLTQANRAIAILNGQRDQVAQIVTDTDTLVAELARRRGRVADFLDQASRVTSQTASRRGPLADTIRRLPGLLRSARPALRNLDQVTADLPPILANVRASAPGLNRLVNDVGPFVGAARPAVARLGAAADVGRRTVKDATPVVHLLRRFARQARITGPLVNQLVVSLQQRGVVEQLLTFTYRVAATAAPYDATSHIAGAHFFSNSCTTFATAPAADCDNHYAAKPSATTASAGAASAAARSATSAPAATPAPAPSPAPAATPAPATAPAALPKTTKAARELLQKALALSGKQPSKQDVQALVDYLLK